MIPKAIHFIQLGKLPAYLPCAMRAYKDLNPDFKVDLVHIPDITDSSVPCFDFCLDAFLDVYNNTVDTNNTDELYKRVVRHVRFEIGLLGNAPRVANARAGDITQNFYPIISEAYRHMMLYMRGGIYVDSDTYPLRGFDDGFLAHDEVRAAHDSYFFASRKHNRYMFHAESDQGLSPAPYEVRCALTGDAGLVRKFFAGELTHEDVIGVGHGEYFIHFCQRGWVSGDDNKLGLVRYE